MSTRDRSGRYEDAEYAAGIILAPRPSLRAHHALLATFRLQHRPLDAQPRPRSRRSLAEHRRSGDLDEELKKIRYEPFKGRVLFHATYFDALDFLAELTQHIPPTGLYSSHLKGRWTRMPP